MNVRDAIASNCGRLLLTASTVFHLVQCMDKCLSVNVLYLFSSPTVALVEEKILCMHGGLSPDLHDLDQVKKPLC